MNLSLDYLFQYLRHCANCGSFRVPGGHLLCQHCWDQANRHRRASLTIRNNHKIWAIWNWQPQANDALSALLLAVKGKTPRPPLRLLAHELINLRLADGSRIPRNAILVPAPSARAPTSDHALLLSQALARELNAELCPVLRKQKLKHQRSLSKIGRTQIQVAVDEKFSLNEIANRPIVLVDDVLTTGATAEASWIALGQPRNFEIWCLAERLLPCGDRGTLL